MRELTMLLAATILLGLAGCQPETDTQADETVSTGAAEDEVAAPELAADLAEARAFEAAWDAAAPVTASDPRLNDDEDARWPEPIQGSYVFEGGELVPLSTDLFALVSSGHTQSGRGKGAVAIHYLTQTEDGFRRVGSEPLFIAGGDAGQPPSFIVEQGLTPSPALVITTSIPANGGTCASSQLVELAPSQPVLRATGIPARYQAAQADRSWQGAFQPGRTGRDFDVGYTGASEGTATWVLTDAGTYRASGQPRLAGC